MYSFPNLEPVCCSISSSNSVSLPAYWFLRNQVRWFGIPISFRIFHTLWWSTVKDFVMVNKAEVDDFLELSCFFDDPPDVGNLISGSSAFSKSSWNIWKFLIHILLKPGLENFEHYFASMQRIEGVYQCWWEKEERLGQGGSRGDREWFWVNYFGGKINRIVNGLDKEV